MADVVGRLFREFAITLAVAILISLVVSLTLTPMMCARLLKREPKEEEQSRFYRASGAWIDWLIDIYAGGLRWVLRHQPLTLLAALATLALTVLLYIVVPRAFSGAGHRRDPGYFGSATVGLLCCHEPASAGAG